jgi:hypothetical protein
MKNLLFSLAIMLLAITNIEAQNYVQNGNFAEAATDESTGLNLPDHWTLEGKALLDDGTKILNLVTSWLPAGSAEGTQALDLWRATDEPYQLKLWQEITGLPDGIYSLSAIAALGGENVFSLFAKVSDDEKTEAMNESGNFEKKELNNVRVTGGSAIIGFTANSSSSSNWFDITNFEFVKTGDLTSMHKISGNELSITVTEKSIRVLSDELVHSANLISIDGKLLYSKAGTGKEVIFSDLQAGIYILQINHASGVQTKKILI